MGLAAHEVVLLLETDVASGLTTSAAEGRLRRFGANLLPEAEVSGPVVRFFRQFHNPLVYVLLAAGVITLVLGDGVDSAVIFGVVLVNALVGFVQESKAEAALDALRSMVGTEARVRRDGRQRTVRSEELVPGDVVLIEAGDKVPADLRLLDLAELQVDESALTGESVPVPKDEVVLAAATPVTDRHNMVYSGTLVTHGTGLGVVVATGSETELGEIHRLVGSAEDLATPLTRKLARFSKILTAAILGLAGLTFAVGVARGEDASEMFNAAVALAVGAIPEGLPAAVTITLAIGVHRMAQQRAVIRRMPAVETLGSTTVICADKTGTLTENQMTVRAIWTPSDVFEVTGSGYQPEGVILDPAGASADLARDEALRWTLLVGAACNDVWLSDMDGTWEVIGDPTEGAVLVAAAKAGIDATWVRQRFPRGRWRCRSALNASTWRLSTTTQSPVGSCARKVPPNASSSCAPGRWVVTDRGPTWTGQACTAPPRPSRGQGLRVLATAMARLDAGEPFAAETLGGTLTLTGLHAMADPPRAEAIPAVRSCHSAGIDVKMITGDHASTACGDRRQSSGSSPPTTLAWCSPAPTSFSSTLPNTQRRVARTQVFARVSPEQKLRLVEALQGRKATWSR